MVILSRSSCRNYGRSWLRVIVAIGLITLTIIAAFYKLRQNAVVGLEHSREVRLDAISEALNQDVRRLLTEVESAINDKQVESAAKLLRKASILDVNGEFTVEVQQLKALITRLEVNVARESAAAALFERARFAMISEDFDQASKLIEEGESQNLTSDALAELKLEVARLKSLKLERDRLVKMISRDLSEWNLKSAKSTLSQLKVVGYPPEKLKAISQQCNQREALNTEVLAEIAKLQLLDDGKYSAEVDKRLIQALELAPQHPKLLKLQKKFSSYPQIVKVPAEFASIEEALIAINREGVILLGEGTFYLSSTIKKPVHIKGEGVGITRVESGFSGLSGITFSHPGEISTLTGLSFYGNVESTSRHSLLLLQAGTLKVSNCVVSDSSAHGIAVSSGTLELIDSVVSNNLWCGVAGQGAKSNLLISDSELLGNGHHGLSVWGGAKLNVNGSRFDRNAQTGLVVSGAGTLVSVEGSSCSGNRESGVYVSTGASLKGVNLDASNNLLSGVVIKSKSSVEFLTVKFSRNGEYGYIIDKSSTISGDKQISGESNVLGRVSRRRIK